MKCGDRQRSNVLKTKPGTTGRDIAELLYNQCSSITGNSAGCNGADHGSMISHCFSDGYFSTSPKKATPKAATSVIPPQTAGIIFLKGRKSWSYMTGSRGMP